MNENKKINKNNIKTITNFLNSYDFNDSSIDFNIKYKNNGTNLDLLVDKLNKIILTKGAYGVLLKQIDILENFKKLDHLN